MPEIKSLWTEVWNEYPRGYVIATNIEARDRYLMAGPRIGNRVMRLKIAENSVDPLSTDLIFVQYPMYWQTGRLPRTITRLEKGGWEVLVKNAAQNAALLKRSVP